MHNVILIGMPGVGKSTLGVLLAKTLGMTFLDTDLVIQDQKKALLRELIQRSRLPWLICITTGTEGSRLKPLLAPLKGDAAVAAVHLNRLEDEDLRQLLSDLLGPEAVPEAVQRELIHRSLGNPGLLQSLLELAQQDGALAWRGGRWQFTGRLGKPVKAHEDLVNQVLLGRLQRLTPAALAEISLDAMAASLEVNEIIQPATAVTY